MMTSSPGGRGRRRAAAGRSVRPGVAAVVAGILAVVSPGPASPGVRLGDAVPGVIKGADLERIKRQLDLDRFSVVAAVWLGATEGREAVVVEPLPDAAIARIKESCSRGAFCPDRFGFVGSRIRIVLLQNNDVLTSVTIDRQARGARGVLFDPLEFEGGPAAGDPAARIGAGDGAAAGSAPEFVGWSGWAEGVSGHVALVLTPIVGRTRGRLAAAGGSPFRIRWNEGNGHFERYDCVPDEEGDEDCAFAGEEAP